MNDIAAELLFDAYFRLYYFHSPFMHVDGWFSFTACSPYNVWQCKTLCRASAYLQALHRNSEEAPARRCAELIAERLGSSRGARDAD